MRVLFLLLAVCGCAGALYWSFLQWRGEVAPWEGVVPPPTASGQKVPLFSGASLEGAKFQFDPAPHARSLIVFWASWCAPCAQETPSLIALAGRHQDWRLIAVTVDSNKRDILNFVRIFPGLRAPNIEIVWDQNQKIARAFGVSGYPESFLVDNAGRLIQKFTGSVDWSRL